MWTYNQSQLDWIPVPTGSTSVLTSWTFGIFDNVRQKEIWRVGPGERDSCAPSCHAAHVLWNMQLRDMKEGCFLFVWCLYRHLEMKYQEVGFWTSSSRSYGVVYGGGGLSPALWYLVKKKRKRKLPLQQVTFQYGNSLVTQISPVVSSLLPAAPLPCCPCRIVQVCSFSLRAQSAFTFNLHR